MRISVEYFNKIKPKNIEIFTFGGHITKNKNNRQLCGFQEKKRPFLLNIFEYIFIKYSTVPKNGY